MSPPSRLTTPPSAVPSGATCHFFPIDAHLRQLLQLPVTNGAPRQGTHQHASRQGRWCAWVGISIRPTCRMSALSSDCSAHRTLCRKEGEVAAGAGTTILGLEDRERSATTTGTKCGMIRQGGGCRRCPVRLDSPQQYLALGPPGRARYANGPGGAPGLVASGLVVGRLFSEPRSRSRSSLVAVESSRVSQRKRGGAMAAVSSPFLFRDAFLVEGVDASTPGGSWWVQDLWWVAVYIPSIR
ncbi:hypothetical protein QBC39DRAFT_337644 [Podospora conica]|nr:hypothetical protein QBC39DRAFT_337644 [Schizothecium conicum]